MVTTENGQEPVVSETTTIETTGVEVPDGGRPEPTKGGAKFDAVPYIRQLRGRGGGPAADYLDVKWRLLWLRREHPDAEIVTEHIRIDDAAAVFRAKVTVPSGGTATGYGSETAGDFGDFIEKAETKSIGRALNALGYSAEAAGAEEPDTTRAPQTLSGRPPQQGQRAPVNASVPDARKPIESGAPMLDGQLNGIKRLAQKHGLVTSANEPDWPTIMDLVGATYVENATITQDQAAQVIGALNAYKAT